MKFDLNSDGKVDITDFLQIVREADSGLNGPPPGQGTPPPGYEPGHNLVVGMNEALASKDPGRVNEYKKWLETLNPEQLQANLQNPGKSFDMWDGMTSGTPPSQQGDQRLDALYARAAQLGISIAGLTLEEIQAAVRAAEEGGSTDASRLADRIAASGVTDEMLIERFGPGGDGSLTNPEIELNSGTREWWINKYQKQQANLDAGLNLDGTNRQFTSGERLPSDILANAKPEEIIAGILTHRDRGYSDDLIRQSMVTAGFTPEQIDQGFLALGAGTNGVDPVVSGTNGVDPVVSGTNGVDPVVSGTNGATDTEDIFTPDDLSTTPDPDFQGLGDTGDILADLTTLLRNRLNTTGLDAIGERDLADFLELRGRGREQSIEELNRLGLYDLGRGAGASADVLGTFDTGTARGRLDINAQAQIRRDKAIEDLFEVVAQGTSKTDVEARLKLLQDSIESRDQLALFNGVIDILGPNGLNLLASAGDWVRRRVGGDGGDGGGGGTPPLFPSPGSGGGGEPIQLPPLNIPEGFVYDEINNRITNPTTRMQQTVNPDGTLGPINPLPEGDNLAQFSVEELAEFFPDEVDELRNAGFSDQEIVAEMERRGSNPVELRTIKPTDSPQVIDAKFRAATKRNLKLAGLDWAARFLFEGDMSFSAGMSALTEAGSDFWEGQAAQMVASAFAKGNPLVAITTAVILHSMRDGEFLGLGNDQGRAILERLQKNPDSVTWNDVSTLRGTALFARNNEMGQDPSSIQIGGSQYARAYHNYTNTRLGGIEKMYVTHLIERQGSNLTQQNFNGLRNASDGSAWADNEQAILTMALEALERNNGNWSDAVDEFGWISDNARKFLKAQPSGGA